MSVKRISLISIPKAGKTALFLLGASLMGWASGLMILSKLARLIQDISKQTDMVYFCIAEHLPWDAINLLGLLRTPRPRTPSPQSCALRTTQQQTVFRHPSLPDGQTYILIAVCWISGMASN